MERRATHKARRRMDGDVGVFLGRTEVARIGVGERVATVEMGRPGGLALAALDATVEEAVARFGPEALDGLAHPPRHRRDDGASLVVLSFLARRRDRLGIDPQAALPEAWADLAGVFNRTTRLDPYEVYRGLRETLPGCADAFWQHHYRWATRTRGEFLESLPRTGAAAAMPEEARPDGRHLEVRRLGTGKVVRRIDVTGKDAGEVEATLRTVLRGLGKGLYVEDTANEASEAPGPAF